MRPSRSGFGVVEVGCAASAVLGKSLLVYIATRPIDEQRSEPRERCRPLSRQALHALPNADELCATLGENLRRNKW